MVERRHVGRTRTRRSPTSGLSVAAGSARRSSRRTRCRTRRCAGLPTTRSPALADMDRAGILASLCFPSFPRFCGQIFWEAKDKELALLCVQAYNDWMIDEWCGTAPGRFIPLVIIPLWDPAAAAAEIERCAAKGATAFAFSENPEPLGLPTIHDPSATGTRSWRRRRTPQMVVCMHVGSSSTMPAISSDAPALANLTFGAVRAAGTMLGVVVQRRTSSACPDLKIALSEGNIGWMPYFIERAEQVPRQAAALGARAWSTACLRQQGVDPAGDGRPRPPRRAGHVPRPHLRVLHRGDVRPPARSTSSARTT